MRHCAGLVAAMAVLLPSMRAADMTTDKSAPPSRIAGAWNVSYEDLALGEIDGVATVDPDGRHVKVLLQQAGSARKFTLTADSVEEKGDDYTIVLTGESPSSPTLMPDERTQRQAAEAQGASSRDALTVIPQGVVPAPVGLYRPPARTPAQPFAGLNIVVRPPPATLGSAASARPVAPLPDVHVEVPNEAGTIELHIADFDGEVELKARHAVEADRVELRLHYEETGGAGGYGGEAELRLTGTWRFFADPLTWRDAQGRGRVGYFRRSRLNPNLATQSAAEVWIRPMPPSHLQLFAVGVFNWKRIDRLYLGVPTIVEAIFDEPQDNEMCTVEVQVGDRRVQLPAHRDPENRRRFLSDPFMPGDDTRPAPPPTTRPVPAAPSKDETDAQFPPDNHDF
jgi:hypothetical protein